MYTLNTASTTKKMTVHEIRDVGFGNYYKRIRLIKESS